MNLNSNDVFLFDMAWTDDADYEHVFDDMLHDKMAPFFKFKKAEYRKVVDNTGYKGIASVYANFPDEKTKYMFMLKFADKLNELR